MKSHRNFNFFIYSRNKLFLTSMNIANRFAGTGKLCSFHGGRKKVCRDGSMVDVQKLMVYLRKRFSVGENYFFLIWNIWFFFLS